MDGSAEFSVGFAKKLAFRLFRRMLHIATGRWIADPTTGLQGLSRKAVLYYSKYNHFDDKYPDTNMITQMMLLDFKVVEIPAVMHIRTSGTSMHSGLKPIWYMTRMFYKMFQIHCSVSECHLRFFLCCLETCLELVRCLCDTHSLSPTAKCCLNDDWITDLTSDLLAFFYGIDRLLASRNNRNTCFHHRISCNGFISKSTDHL